MMYSWNWDIAIFVGFLAVNLAVGIYHGRGVKSLEHYAIGNRNFSSAAIAATITATWIGGSSLAIKVSESYSKGLYYITTGLVDPLSFLIIAYILAPRMSEFLGKLSIAEAMGELYGKKVRIITAISGVIGTIGFIAVQFKVSASLFNHFFGINGLYGTLISSAIVIFYTSYCGIRAVTLTDAIQLFAFCVFIPSLALLVWGTLNDPAIVFNTLAYHPLFDYSEVFNIHSPKFFSWLGMLMFFLLPGIDPAVFQRISMARNPIQIRASFILASIICLLVGAVMYWIGILLLSADPNLNPNQLIGYVVSRYSYPGLIGFTCAGILAMVMSTADSYIHSSAVLISHDIVGAMSKQSSSKNELALSRLFAALIGAIAIIPALSPVNLLELIVITFSFYMPIVTVPFVLAVLGFRSTGKSALIGMAAGFITVLIFNALNVGIDSVIPGMAANLIFLMGSHYLLKQAGGWVGIKDDSLLKALRMERQRKIQHLIQSIKNFSLLTFCKNNSPKQEHIYSFFGLFCVISIFSAMYSMPREIQQQSSQVLEWVYHTALISSTIFLSYPIWPPTFKKDTFIIVAWPIGIFYMLIFVGSLLVIISNFGQLQLMIFMINLIVVATLLRWQVAIGMIFAGVFASIYFYKSYMGIELLPGNIGTLQFKIIYLLVLFSSVLIAFLKPKQKYEELSENKVKDMKEKLEKQQGELIKSLRHQVEFVKSLDEGCIKVFETINEQAAQLKDNLKNVTTAEEVKKATEQLLQTTEKLEAGAKYLSAIIYEVHEEIKIKLQKVNLKDLTNAAIEEYKLLNPEHSLNFTLEIQTRYNEIECDPHLIKKIIKDFISHAGQNSEEGNILNIVWEDSSLEYNVNLGENYIKKIEGVKLSVINSRKTLSSAELELLMLPSFQTIDSIDFANDQRIARAHYGKFAVYNHDQQGAVYSFAIPARIKEVRPKLMDLPDDRLDNLQKITELVAKIGKEEMRKIAKELLKIGMSPYHIAKITNFTEEEISKLVV